MRYCYLILALLLWCSASSAADRWAYFVDPAGAFTVAVPAEPVAGHETSRDANGRSIQLTTYVIQRRNSVLGVIITDLSQFADDGHLLEDGVAKFRASAASGFSDMRITVDGHAGHEIHYTDQRGVKFEDRLFLVNRNLYQVMVELRPGADANSFAVAHHFIGSVHFPTK